MIEISNLENAIRIHTRSYKLLKWLAKAIREGFVSTTRAHNVTSAADAAALWVQRHYHNLPLNCRPDEKDIEAFGRFFGTYLETSFDLLDQPEVHYLPGSCDCICAMCRRLSNPQHLKPKSLTKQDKTRALKLRSRRIETLALEEGLRLPEASIVALTTDESLRQDVSLSAYGASLLERLEGTSPGPAILSLWRDIAWDRRGSPLRKFELKASDITSAEQRLLALIKEQSIP